METRSTGRAPHEIREVPPTACSNGHPFRGPRTAYVGFLPCSCAGDNGHRTYRCATCGVLDFYPPHDSAARGIGSLYDPPAR